MLKVWVWAMVMSATLAGRSEESNAKQGGLMATHWMSGDRAADWARLNERRSRIFSPEQLAKFRQANLIEQQWIVDEANLEVGQMGHDFYTRYSGDLHRIAAAKIFLARLPYFLKPAPAGLDPSRPWSELSKLLKVDEKAQTTWLRRGDAIAAEIRAMSGVSRDEKEAVDHLLMKRDRLAALSRVSYWKEPQDAVDWAELQRRFDAHVSAYGDLDIVTERAQDYVSNFNGLFAPAIAREIWAHLRQLECERLREAAALQLDSGDMVAARKAFRMRFTALDGREIDLERLRGKVVLIDFWATWCKPCVDEMPVIKALYRKYVSQGLEVIGVSSDLGTKEELQSFLNQHGYDWPQHFDGRGPGNNFARLFAVTSWPTTFLLNREGELLTKNVRGPQLEPTIRKALGLDAP